MIARTSDDQTIEARQAEIVGQPPRIAASEAVDEGALAFTGRLRQIGSRRPPPTSMDEVPEIVKIMFRHPGLYERHVELGLELGLHGALSPRQRELVTLRIAWLCQAPFEWGEHVKKARAMGFAAEEIERIIAGSAAPGWDELEGAMVKAVEELYARTMISDETWAILARHCDEKQLIELPILVGHYHLVAYSQNSLRIRLGDDNQGLFAR